MRGGGMIRALLLPAVGVLLLLGVLIWGAAMGGFPPWLLGMGVSAVGIVVVGLLQPGRGAVKESVLSFAYSLFVALSAIFVYLIAANHNRTFDITEHQLHSLSPQTGALLARIESPVRIAAFADIANQRFLREFLEQYADQSEHVQFEIFDPSRDRLDAQAFGENIQPREAFVTTYDADGNQQRRHRFVLDPANPRREYFLSNALLTVLYGRDQVIYMTQGHGERAPEPDMDRAQGEPDTSWSAFLGILNERIMPVKTVNLGGMNRVPEDAAAVLIASPLSDLSELEREVLTEYLDEGGALLVALEPAYIADRQLPNLDALIRYAGLESPNQVIIDPYAPASELLTSAYLTGDHPIARAMGRIPILMNSARPIRATEDTRTDANKTVLLVSNDQVWAQDAQELRRIQRKIKPLDDEKIGVQALAALSSYPTPDGLRSDRARVALFGDADFVANNAQEFSAGATLTYQTVNWLVQRDDQLAIPPKLVPPSGLLLTQTRFYLMCGTLLVIGLGLLGGGVAYSVARRRLK
ncbi:MAG: GldG family protein [Sumerlaeia bacterium]